MKRPITLLLICLTILLSACSSKGDGSLAPDAPPDAVPSLEGNYVVHGFDPLGTEYGGVLTIFSTDIPTQYTMQWIIVGSIQEGEGILEGNMLKVNWESLVDSGDKVHGSAVYTVTVNGELYGTRTIAGNIEEGIETAYPKH